MKIPHFIPGASFCAAIALSSMAFTAHGQQHATKPGGHMDMPNPSADSSPSTAAFKKGGAKMMKDMNAPYTGDTDKDFVSHMLPHHQGAVDMAEVELKYGKDPALRQLAESIIKAQDEEIAIMKKWQAEHGVK